MQSVYRTFTNVTATAWEKCTAKRNPKPICGYKASWRTMETEKKPSIKSKNRFKSGSWFTAINTFIYAPQFRYENERISLNRETQKKRKREKEGINKLSTLKEFDYKTYTAVRSGGREWELIHKMCWSYTINIFYDGKRNKEKNTQSQILSRQQPGIILIHSLNTNTITNTQTIVAFNQ